MSTEEAKHRTYQESDGIYHATGAIAFRLWRATLYPVEITSGQNFGEEQVEEMSSRQRLSTQIRRIGN